MKIKSDPRCAEADAGPHASVLRVIATLERSIIWLSENEPVRTAREDLDAAITAGDAAKAVAAATTLYDGLDLVRKLTKAADEIDPHVLDPAQLRSLRRLKPTELVDDALLKGKLRERRILLEAMEANTNMWAARIAIAAAIGASAVALAVPLVERLVGR